MGLRDHPRSRGVYVVVALPAHADGGSSPLARGLLPALDPLPSWAGIIPARAGVTQRVPPGEAGRADHPRSRGVYLSLNIDLVNESGSSPLARGLRGQDGGDAAPPGIIPARAGFTDPDRQDRRPRADHPRSRGVYDLSRRVTAAELGSSPLARGLPTGDRRLQRLAGIIPARAGFTAAGPIRSMDRKDHPRSRGVYRPRRSRDRR